MVITANTIYCGLCRDFTIFRHKGVIYRHNLCYAEFTACILHVIPRPGPGPHPGGDMYGNFWKRVTPLNTRKVKKVPQKFSKTKKG